MLATMRVSDSERQRAIDELRRHCAAGRIDVDEYAARIERALMATTLQELDVLRADLPMIRIADPAAETGHVWARVHEPATPESPGGGGRSWALGQALSASLIVALSAVVVVAALVIALVAGWTWAVVLIAGWLVGVAQGRLGRWSR